MLYYASKAFQPICACAAYHIMMLISAGMLGVAVQYPNHDQSDYLGLQLLKVQDTCPIHSAHMSQHVALGSLQKGRPWLAGQLKGLEGNRYSWVWSYSHWKSAQSGYDHNNLRRTTPCVPSKTALMQAHLVISTHFAGTRS